MIGPVKLALVVTLVAVAAFPPILRLATGVVEVTVNGAVPVAIVDTTTGALKFPVVVRLVPVAAPMFGVTRLGEAAITKVLPVPVCDDTLVALPTEVIGPVRLAFVLTVPAVNPAAVPVIFVPTKVLGVPRFGVVRTGDIANTARPVPVSSDNAPAKPAEFVSVFCLPAAEAAAAVSA